jgi:hypothetical protein
MYVKRPASVEPAGRPVDCLGLTKRWSLYVASHGNSRVGAEAQGWKAIARPTRWFDPYSPASVRAVAPAFMRLEPRLEQPALSLSHLTWS